MDYSYGGTLHELPFSAYETLLVDAMEGDMTLFNRGDQVEDGVAHHGAHPATPGQTPPPRGVSIYEAGTLGPGGRRRPHRRDGHTWRRP